MADQGNLCGWIRRDDDVPAQVKLLGDCISSVQNKKSPEGPVYWEAHGFLHIPFLAQSQPSDVRNVPNKSTQRKTNAALQPPWLLHHLGPGFIICPLRFAEFGNKPTAHRWLRGSGPFLNIMFLIST